MQKKTTRNELIQAVEEFMKNSFPERSADKEADDLHADLLLFDGAVGDAMMTLAHGGRVPREDLASDPELRGRLERLAASENTVAAADARIYLEYMDGLEHLLELARSMAGGKPGKR